MNKDLELKFFVFAASLAFLCVIGFTRIKSPARPIGILSIYLAYLFFQCLHMIEFFPITAFQMFSYPEGKMVDYDKLTVLLEDGNELKIFPHKVLPVLKDGYTRRYISDAVEDPKVAQEFTDAFARAYERRIRKPGKPKIKEVRFEKWKWSFDRDPRDPNHGYVVKRSVAAPGSSEVIHA